MTFSCSSNLDTKSDRLHDKDPVREDSSDFLHTGKILDRIPDVPVFIQQLELSYREDGSGTRERDEKGGGGVQREVERWTEEEEVSWKRKWRKVKNKVREPRGKRKMNKGEEMRRKE